MAKSKNRKNHSKKVQARRQKMTESKNRQTKQFQSWIKNLQSQSASQIENPLGQSAEILNVMENMNVTDVEAVESENVNDNLNSTHETNS